MNFQIKKLTLGLLLFGGNNLKFEKVLKIFNLTGENGLWSSLGPHETLKMTLGLGRKSEVSQGNEHNSSSIVRQKMRFY
jgi:hypothetical protein